MRHSFCDPEVGRVNLNMKIKVGATISNLRDLVMLAQTATPFCHRHLPANSALFYTVNTSEGVH